MNSYKNRCDLSKVGIDRCRPKAILVSGSSDRSVYKQKQVSHLLYLVVDWSVWLKTQKVKGRFSHNRSTTMPWNSGITEALQKRIARYVIKHYLGRFIDHPISLDDLTFELVNGRIELTKLDLDVIVSISCFDFWKRCQNRARENQNNTSTQEPRVAPIIWSNGLDPKTFFVWKTLKTQNCDGQNSIVWRLLFSKRSVAV